MIWICTFCLLFVAAWLFFNGLNERRWVQAHSHDESVNGDQGLLSSFSARTGTGAVGSDGKVSIDQEDSGFAKAVQKVQEKTSKFGETFFESKVAAAKVDRSDASAGEDASVFDRTVARVGESAGRVDEKLSEKIRHASSQTRSAPVKEENLIERTSRQIVSKSSEVGNKISTRAKDIAQGLGDGHSATDENGMFSKMVDKVSTGVHSGVSAVKDKDLVSRVSEKISQTVNQLDKKNASSNPNKSQND